MKAVGYYSSLPIDHADALQDLLLPEPQPGPRDLLVEVRAVSVNPVDTKVRQGAAPEPGQAKVLGWDAAGMVRAVGAEVANFRPGDRVWYAGSIARSGSNAELQLVDERIAGPMPASLDFAQAAALPLTAITAWEMLFDRMGLHAGQHQGQSLLVVGAAGGVGSVLLQLARHLTGLSVIATASRPESADWVRQMGAHQVLDHSRPLAGELARAGLAAPEWVVSLNQTEHHFAQLAELIAPQGRFGLIDDPAASAIDIGLLKRKSVSLHWEFMFTRSLFATPDMGRQGSLLREVAALVDQGALQTTVAENFGPINAHNLKKAHALIESGRATGKVVLEGF